MLIISSIINFVNPRVLYSDITMDTTAVGSLVVDSLIEESLVVDSLVREDNFMDILIRDTIEDIVSSLAIIIMDIVDIEDTMDINSQIIIIGVMVVPRVIIMTIIEVINLFLNFLPLHNL